MPRPRMLCCLLFAVCARLGAAELTLSIAPRWHGEDVGLPATRTNEHGQALRMTRFAAILSGATLLRADGNRVQLEGQYGFIDAAEGRLSWTLHNVPSGEFVGLEFQIGVPPEINHADPGRWAADHPLNPIVNALHWSWQGGYVFVALEGKWRETGAVDGAIERGFSYHLATDPRVMSVRFRANYEVRDATTIELAVDLARALAGQRLDAEDGSESTHSAAGDARADRLTAAFEHAWFFLRAESRSRERQRVETTDHPLAHARGSGATPYAFTVPAGFPQPNLAADNPLTVEGIALGGQLFFDPRLSANGRQSCASCHRPDRAFSDTVAFSLGAAGQKGARNAMPLFNLAWSSAFAWDSSQPRIRDQARAAWTNPIEMQADPAQMVVALQRDEALAQKFAAAFGDATITAERVTLALEQFLLTQVAADSKFDRAMRGQLELSEAEKRGFELFATEFDPAHGRRGADCFHCHGGALFTDFALKNNGLDLRSSDGGRGNVTGRADDAGKFKTPSLRNVALTAPYMHDGRFATLEEVVAHYDHGVQRAAALDPNIAKHPAEGLQLSLDDQQALVAFLRTLTESRFQVAQVSDVPSSEGPAAKARAYSSPSQ